MEDAALTKFCVSPKTADQKLLRIGTEWSELHQENSWDISKRAEGLGKYDYVAIIGTILLCVNEWILLNRIISVKQQHSKIFNCVQIKLFVNAILKTSSLCAKKLYRIICVI